MNTIKELFDPSKDLTQRIETVITFADAEPEQLEREIKEYVITDKLHDNYENVISELQDAFSNGSNEIGVWVSGFYGSGKSSFAKYLGLSFQRSLMIDGISFGEALMNRTNDVALKSMHRTVIKNYNPLVILIDLTTQATAGKTSMVSDIIYAETMKLLGISTTDPKLVDFLALLQIENKYDEFVSLVASEGKDWDVIVNNRLIANRYAATFAPVVLPQYFSSKEDFNSIKVDSNESETERFKRIIELIKKRTGQERVIFVLDEVGQYIAASDDLIRSMQGTMQILKSQFKGKVWLIGTAQQTLTEDNPLAQYNSGKLFKLADRFPIKVDIESDDIKEIITKRLLGKSVDGKTFLTTRFNQNESNIKLNTKLHDMDRTIYMKPLSADLFANLYPFLPVHIDILMSLLQKLASRTGGTGLRPIIRLIRDILIDGSLADKPLDTLATPDLFYDALMHDMEKNPDFREIVAAAKKAIEIFSSDPLAVKACKTIAVMQLLDDFQLSLDNIAALLYGTIGKPVDKTKLSEVLNDIKDTPGLTLQQVDGRWRFMTNAILTIQEERSHIIPNEGEKNRLLQQQVNDILSPAPSVQIYGSKGITPTVELSRGRQTQTIHSGGDLKVNIRFIDRTEYPRTHQALMAESTNSENERTIYWLCTLPSDIEWIMQEIVKDDRIVTSHNYDENQEIKDYLRAQKDDAQTKRRQLRQILLEALTNSEVIEKGSPRQLEGTISNILQNFTAKALKPFAERAYNKYNLAAHSMSSTVIRDLYAYEETNQVPKALNPFDIIGDDGSIDTTNAAFAEIKDFISSNVETTGAQILEKFSSRPYGWSKDTIRYLVALMLKASMVEIRRGGQPIAIFSERARNEMNTNQLFSTLGIYLNTRQVLSASDNMKAMTRLKELYNPGQIAPVPQQIAKAALKVAISKKAEVDKLHDTFKQYDLEGSDRVARAANFLGRIINSDGADAPYLLAKDDSCYESLSFVKEIERQELQAHLLTNIKKIARRLNDSSWIGSVPMLDTLASDLDEIRQAYNDLRENPDCQNLSSDYADILSKVDANIQRGCLHFYSEAQRYIRERMDEIKESADFAALKDDQKQEIEHLFSRIIVDEPNDLESLRRSNDQYSCLFNPGGLFDVIKRKIADFKRQNEAVPAPPPVVPQPDITPPSNDTHEDGEHDMVHDWEEPVSKKLTLSVKRKVTSKTELEAIISTLQGMLSQFETGTTLDLTIED